MSRSPARDTTTERRLLRSGLKLLERGVPIKTAERMLGVGQNWLRRRVVDGWAAKEAEKRRRKHVTNHLLCAGRAYRPMCDHSLRIYRENMGPDTRDFSARHLGDPLPGRSALDQKRMRE